METNMDKAFEIWWEKLRNLRNKFCRETYLIGYEKEDLEQECYFLFREAWEQFDEDKGISFAGYYKVKLYGWRANMTRKIKRHDTILIEDEVEFKDESIDVENDMIRKVLCEKGLSQLSEMEYEIIEAFYFKQESLKEIAERLQLTYKSVEARKRKIIEKLRVSLRG